MLEQVAKTNQYDIPTTAMVIEAWADEETFYIWGDAQYTPRSATWTPTSSDFTYTGRWPDPKGMVDTLHENGIKVLLWQLPVIRSASQPIEQLATDEAYAIAQGYVLGHALPQQGRLVRQCSHARFHQFRRDKLVDEQARVSVERDRHRRL